jgi:pyruvate/2-oxoglutarate dehydrogenase complex dihydrolipoamide dehydrogenase (E3) component
MPYGVSAVAEQEGESLIAMNDSPRVLPLDEHNRRLVHNVYPDGWRNPEPAPRYNLVVIGAGTAGLITAAGAAGLGAKVALVEKHLMGGDCLNVGCVPSKCIIRSSRVTGELRDAAKLGFAIPAGVTPDFAAVMERMRRLRAHISEDDSVWRYRDQLGIDVFLGEARFSGPDTVTVGDKSLRFKKAVIATGARAVHPPIPGLAEAGFLTNETVFWLTERPRRLAVIGGGPIGCELAQAFRRLGCEVTLFEATGHILNREDADAAEILQNAFVREGIALRLNAGVQRVQQTAGGKAVTFAAGGAEQTVTVDEILVGAGRAPNVEGLNLETVGVEYDLKRGVKVNDQLQTTNPRVFAAGDICMPTKFTHAADAAARIVIQNALFFGGKKLSALTIPWCTYTDPEIAHVGMYERDAQQRGIEVDTFIRPLSAVHRAIADGDEEGFVKVHVKKGSDKIVGATIVARHAGEMINEISLAITAGLGLGTIATVIHPYPTQAEAIKQVADAYNRTRLTPFVKKIFQTYLAWMR